MGYEALPRVSTRKEMYAQLECAISNLGQVPLEEMEDEDAITARKYLKAFIIESNSYLDKIQMLPDIQFESTSERELKLMKITDGDAISYSYLDMLDSRYWVLYSLDGSTRIKTEIIKKLIESNNSRLDYAWFSSKLLGKIGSRYPKTSFSMRFHNTFNNSNIPLKKLSIRLWAEDASGIITNLFENEDIGKGACLTNIETVHSLTQGRYVKSRLGMEGAINISGGNSINDFLEYQTEIIQGHYKPLINLIEETYSTDYSITDGINIKGQILSIKLKEKITNVESFSKDILKGTKPFRMTGFVNKLGDNHYLLNVLDLHTYGHFDLEIFEDEILINLPKGICGNIVTRLYALCQARIDPKAELMGDSNAII